MTSADDIEERIGHQVELIIDGGPVGIEATTVVDLSSGSVDVLRTGRGSTETLV